MPSITDLFRWQGNATDKQREHSYGPVYDAWLAPLVDRPIRLLELGVSLYGGGDLLAFAEFLPLAEIHGFDNQMGPLLMPVANHPQIHVSLCDAYEVDRDGLGMFDVLIDDCLHDRQHQQAAFAKYWPLVAPGGQYIIEDIQAGYAAELKAWLQDQAGPTSLVELHDLTHERPSDNIIARIVRADKQTDSPN